MFDNQTERAPDQPTIQRAPVPASLADITERLMSEFGGRLNLSVISRTVLDSRNDLAGSRPESVEALARQRLTATARPSSLAPLLESSGPA